MRSELWAPAFAGARGWCGRGAGVEDRHPREGGDPGRLALSAAALDACLRRHDEKGGDLAHPTAS